MLLLTVVTTGIAQAQPGDPAVNSVGLFFSDTEFDDTRQNPVTTHLPHPDPLPLRLGGRLSIRDQRIPQLQGQPVFLPQPADDGRPADLLEQQAHALTTQALVAYEPRA